MCDRVRSQRLSDCTTLAKCSPRSLMLWPSLQAEMPSLAAGMATAQQADIIIGVHGA